MRNLIVQDCNGITAGNEYRSTANRIDHGNSRIFASSLFIHQDETGKNIAQPKDSDDKIVIGYTPQGHAFQIVVNGTYGCDRQAVFSFIDKHVLPLMEQYSLVLSQSKNSAAISKNLVNRIYALHQKHGEGVEFAISIAMTYEQKGQLFCAGFGIGDTALAIKRISGEIEQLLCHTEVDNFKDAFDNHCARNPEQVISRNSFFSTRVEAGDELVGYTYIYPELETLLREFSSKNLLPGNPQQEQVKQYSLNLSLFGGARTLFGKLLKLSQESFAEKAKSTGIAQRCGDDFTVGSLIIPSPELRALIKIQNLLSQLYGVIDEYKAILRNQWGFWTCKKHNVRQASFYQQQLEKHQSRPFINKLMLWTIFSDHNAQGLQDFLSQRINLEPTNFLVLLENLMQEELRILYEDETFSEYKKGAQLLKQIRSELVKAEHNNFPIILAQLTELRPLKEESSYRLIVAKVNCML